MSEVDRASVRAVIAHAPHHVPVSVGDGNCRRVMVSGVGLDGKGPVLILRMFWSGDL